MRPGPRIAVWARIVALAVVLGVSGCSTGLPFASGNGSDAQVITVDLKNISNLVPNAEVKVDDVTVGSVTRIRVADWTARIDARIEPGVAVPANVVAAVGQKSLLGAQYLQLKVPDGATPLGTLRSGDVIPLERSTTYPATEDLLIALSSVLNGSGLSQLRTITTEMNRALDGRTTDIRSLIENLNRTVGTLSAQRTDITRAIDRLQRFSRATERQTPAFERSIDSLAPGVAAVNAQLPVLERAMKSIDDLNRVAAPVIAANQQGLVTEIRQLQPVLRQLNTAGNDIPDSFNLLFTVLFPMNTIPALFHGDYANLFPIADLQAAGLQRTLFGDQSKPLVGPRAATSTAALFNPRAVGRG